jgi:hypothetical protein
MTVHIKPFCATHINREWKYKKLIFSDKRRIVIGMSYEEKYYPKSEVGQKPPFYVEFERGDRKGEFTLFRRQFMYSEEKLKEFEAKSEDTKWLRMTNEVHPWNIFTAEYGPDGCVPDRKWVEWMVDALNKALDTESKS